MCYSAQVIQMARKLHRQLGIRLDYAEAEKLFFWRLDDPTQSKYLRHMLYAQIIHVPT